MKIHYSKWRQNINLVLGVVWLLYSVLKFIGYSEDEPFRWFDVVFMLMGPLYLGIYFFQQFRGMLSIDDEKVELNALPKKTIYFNNLKEIKFSFGDYRFKDLENKEIIIAKESIAKHQIAEFDKKFHQIQEEFNAKINK